MEEGGVEGRWWVEERGDAGQMGVKAEAAGRVEAFGAELGFTSRAAE